MGLLFEKYSDPLTFLDISVDLMGIKNTVKKVYEDEEEKKLWQLYLAFKPKESFREWKNKNAIDVTYAVKNNVGTKNKEETDKIINDSKNILRNFKLVKGGKYNGKQ